MGAGQHKRSGGFVHGGELASSVLVEAGYPQVAWSGQSRWPLPAFGVVLTGGVRTGRFDAVATNIQAAIFGALGEDPDLFVDAGPEEPIELGRMVRAWTVRDVHVRLWEPAVVEGRCCWSLEPQSFHLASALESVRAVEAAAGQEYEWLVRIRPDMVYASRLPPVNWWRAEALDDAVYVNRRRGVNMSAPFPVDAAGCVAVPVPDTFAVVARSVASAYFGPAAAAALDDGSNKEDVCSRWECPPCARPGATVRPELRLASVLSSSSTDAGRFLKGIAWPKPALAALAMGTELISCGDNASSNQDDGRAVFLRSVLVPGGGEEAYDAGREFRVAYRTRRHCQAAYHRSLCLVPVSRLAPATRAILLPKLALLRGSSDAVRLAGCVVADALGDSIDDRPIPLAIHQVALATTRHSAAELAVSSSSSSRRLREAAEPLEHDDKDEIAGVQRSLPGARKETPIESRRRAACATIARRGRNLLFVGDSSQEQLYRGFLRFMLAANESTSHAPRRRHPVPARLDTKDARQVCDGDAWALYVTRDGVRCHDGCARPPRNASSPAASASPRATDSIFERAGIVVLQTGRDSRERGRLLRRKRTIGWTRCRAASRAPPGQTWLFLRGDASSTPDCRLLDTTRAGPGIARAVSFFVLLLARTAQPRTSYHRGRGGRMKRRPRIQQS